MENPNSSDQTKKRKIVHVYARKGKGLKRTSRVDAKKKDAPLVNEPRKKAKRVSRKPTEGRNGQQTNNDQVVDRNDAENPDGEEVVTRMPRLETRMSPRDFVTLVKGFTEEQRKSFASTPFRHFVDLKVTKIPSFLAHYVVTTYNFRDHEFKLTNGKTVKVEKEDVHNVLGLPMGPIDMSGAPNTSSKDEEIAFNEWISQFGDDHSGRVVKMNVLRKYIAEHNEEGGAMFKRNIILYVTTKLIYCSNNDHVWLDVFPWLVDIDNLDQLDWCQFIIEKLMTARENWSEGAYFCGPLLFLVLHYVDVVVDGKRDTTRTFPRFKSWTTQDLNKRQMKSSSRGGFGGGYVDKDGPTSEKTSPISTKRVHRSIGRSDSGGRDVDKEGLTDRELVCDEKYQGQGSMHDDDLENEQISMFYDYAKTLENLGLLYKQLEIKGKKLLEKFPRQEDIKKLIRESRKVFNLPSLPNDSEIVDSATEQVAGNETVNKNTDIPLSQDTFFDRPGILDTIEAHFRAAQSRATKSIINGADIEPPSFSLGLTQDFATEPIEPQVQKEGKEDEEYVEDSFGEDSNGDEENAHVTHVALEGDKDGKSLKTPINRDNRFPGKEVRSPFVVRILDPHSRPSKKQMAFAEYLISSQKMPLTSLFKCGDVVTTNEDLRSLVIRDSFVEANVISTYSFILNYRERFKSDSSPSRMFLPVEVTNKLVLFDDYGKSYDTFKTDMDIYFEQWSVFKNPQHVDMFFFPFHTQRHFFVACFSLLPNKKRDDFLDNKPEGGSSLEKYHDLPLKLQNFFSRWLTSKKLHQKSMSVSSLRVSRPQMKWRDESNDCDCAVYTMRHMETYQGDLKEWDAGLEKGQFKPLKILRIKYAYDIVDFTKNELKVNVLSLATRRERSLQPK